MSNYLQNAIHPKTGDIQPAEMLDDCFGRHEYGVLFPDGSLYRRLDVEVVKGSVTAKLTDFDREAAYKEAEGIIAARKKNTK